MRALLIDDSTKKKIAKIIEHAKANISTIENLFEIKESGIKVSPVGDDPNFVLEIPLGYRIVYSIEKHKDTLYHHISISVNTQGAMPSVVAAIEIKKLFGMEADLYECILNIENFAPGHEAISIQEPFVT